MPAKKKSKSKKGRVLYLLRNDKSGYSYLISISSKSTTKKLELKKYDPILRGHYLFKQKKLTS